MNGINNGFKGCYIFIIQGIDIQADYAYCLDELQTFFTTFSLITLLISFMEVI